MKLNHALVNRITFLIITLLLPALHLNSESAGIHDSSLTTHNINKINQNIERIQAELRKDNDTIHHEIIRNLELSASEQYVDGIAWNYFLMGRYYQLRFRNDSARFYYEKAWPLAKKQQILNLTHALSLGLGNIYWESGNYSAGLAFTLEAKRYFEKHSSIDTKYGLMNLIALNYEGLYEYENALYYFKEALRIADSSRNEVFVGIIYSNIGRLYFKQNEYAKALEFLQKGVAIEEDNQVFANAGKSYTTIANAYLETENPDSSYKYLNKALNHNLNAEDHIGLTRTYLSFGRYYFMLKKYRKSIEYLEKTTELAERIHLNNELITSYKLLAQNYEQLEEYRKSNHYYIQYFELYQQIYDVEQINKTNALEHRLKLQTKENQISLLQLNEEKHIKNIFLVTTIAGIFISLLLIFFILFYRKNNKLLKLKNKEIFEQKNILEQLNEKLILAEESAGKADEIKNKFLNNLTHEIRTPLNGIVGFSSLIADSRLSEEKRKETWNIIKQNSENLINTVEGLLKLSLLASNQMSSRKEYIYINSFLEKLHDDVRLKNDYLLNNDLHFTFTTEKQLEHIQINTDPNVLSQIILNLLDNAFKFTSEGNVTIELKESENEIQIVISDNGIGVQEEHDRSIFKQFVKGLNIPNNSSGLGIGLTISCKLAKLIDATISYDSELNKGSTFSIHLPKEL